MTGKLKAWETDAVNKGSYVQVRGKWEGEEGGVRLKVGRLVAVALKDMTREKEVREKMWTLELEEQRSTEEERREDGEGGGGHS